MGIRPLEPADLSQCATVFAAVFSPPPWNEPWEKHTALQHLVEIHRTPGFLGMAATDPSGELIGFLIGCIEQWAEGRYFHLKEMCVRLDGQRTGVGTLLMGATKERLNELGVSRIYLLTARDGTAQHFYKRQGFYVSPKVLMAQRLS